MKTVVTESDHMEIPLLVPIGVVHSSLVSRKDCPRQGWDDAPEAWLEIDAAFAAGLEGIAPGRELIILTWLHLAERDVLQVSPRDTPDDVFKGVFTTRSPDRPNPIGLHRVEVLEVEDSGRLRVGPLEALDGTPIIDIKPVLRRSVDS